MLNYKGYLGRVEFDAEADALNGQVFNTRDVITFQGQSVEEVKQAFRDSVEEYLKFCEECGKEPDKPFSGQFMTRIDPELHREISAEAAASKMSLNAWVESQLRAKVALRSGPKKKNAAGGQQTKQKSSAK